MKNLFIFILSFFACLSGFAQDPEKRFSDEESVYRDAWITAPFTSNPKFEYSKFEKSKSLTSKKTKSGEDRWVPETVYCFDRYNDITRVYRIFLEYNSQGLLIKRLEGNEAGDYFQNSFTYTYDSNHNLHTKLWKYWDRANNSWKNYYLFTYTYDSNNNRLSEKGEWWSRESWSYPEFTYYTYDSDNNLLTEAYSIFLETYTYDSDNNILTKLTRIRRDNSPGENYSLSTYTYDSNHDLLTLLNQNWKNDSWVDYTFVTYTYDSDHNLLIERSQLWRNNSWEDYTQYLMIYDENKNCISAESLIWIPINESWEPVSHNSSGEPLLWLYYNNMQSAIEARFCNKMTASYIKVSDITTGVEPIAAPELNAVSIYPNPTTGPVTIADEGLSITKILVYDLFGAKLIDTTDIILDISHLSAGIYFVRIISEKGVVTKKIVKI